MLTLLTADNWPGSATASPLRVLDPSCGDGRLLIAAQEHLGNPCSLVGCDIDPLTQVAHERHNIEFVVGNGLQIDWSHFGSSKGFDLVMSNPPFLSQLAHSTSRKGSSTRGGGPYANTAMEFCLAGIEALRPGGRLAIVLPQSVLASRDTTELRTRVTSLATMVSSWWSPSPQFDAEVTVAVLIFERRKVTVEGSDAPWTTAITAALGIPPVPQLSVDGTIGDRASASANFRDEYYALVPAVGDHVTGPPLITSGLIDPARCMWGDKPVQFARQMFDAPRVDVAQLTGRFPKWAEKMLHPKVLVAAQTRTIEAVVDVNGEWLPGVPVTTVFPDRVEELEQIASVINSPIAALIAWHERAGTGLSPTSLRLSPSSVLNLPWPANDISPAALQTLSDGNFSTFGMMMCESFGVTRTNAETITEWWRAAGRPRQKSATPDNKNS